MARMSRDSVRSGSLLLLLLSSLKGEQTIEKEEDAVFVVQRQRYHRLPIFKAPPVYHMRLFWNCMRQKMTEYHESKKERTSCWHPVYEERPI